MDHGWASDFSYGYFRNILHALQSNFEAHPIAEAPEVLHGGGRPMAILRHDIDVNLLKAPRMAEIEAEYGLRATYMVMTNSPLYSLEDLAARTILGRVMQMGHEVALHFDLTQHERDGGCSLEAIEARIGSACKCLEDTTGAPVRSVSFHRPLPQFLRGPLWVAGRLNAYAAELMDWYLSDSKGRWQTGEPLPQLRHPKRPLLQLLVHPIWWGEQHASPTDRLEAFLTAETQRRSLRSRQALAAALAAMVPGVRCRSSCDNARAEGA